MVAPTERKDKVLSDETLEFYRQVLHCLQRDEVQFLVGGAYAFARYTGIDRHTRDLDLFVYPRDFDRTLEALAGCGWQAEPSFPHWLGKVHQGEDLVDLIFSSGNGVATVDDLWFEHAIEGEVFGLPVRLVPAEEMIWSKSYIMERERFDGADVAHLLHCCAAELDWGRLLRRFDADGGWRVLFAHLILFGYIYPGHASLIPNQVIATLSDRLRRETAEPPDAARERLCRGPILSRSQYLIDVHRRGYRDAREKPQGNMSAAEIELWTAAAHKDGDVSQLEALIEEG
jgi:hypothetical protein